MQRVRLSDALEISGMVYGMWRLGDDADTSPGHVQAKIEACLEQGITTLDQADIYGGYEAEGLLGKCFAAATGLRDKVEVVTKCDIVAPVGRYSGARVKYYDTSAVHIRQSVESSLRLMDTDRIDLLLIHRPDPLMDHEETGAALDGLIASGDVGAVGVSNFKPHDWTLLQSAMETSLVTNQIEISVLARECFTNGDLAFLQQHGIRPMAWSPLGGGALFDGTAPVHDVLSRMGTEQGVGADAVAIAWLLKHPAGIIPVMGTNRLNRIFAFLDAEKVEMTREDWFEIYTAAQGHEVP